MLIERLTQELQDIRQRGLAREIKDLHYLDAVTARDQSGKKYLVFASNNYLGLTFASEVRQAAAAAALQQGTGSTGSRLTTGGVGAATILEKELAQFKHAEAALIFNTGYMTNLGVLFALAKPTDVIFSDELNHASIIDGCRISKARIVIYKHGDSRDLEQKLQQWEQAAQTKHNAVPVCRFIVSDGVFSMDGDIAPLPELVRLKQQYQATLVLDDAHAVGVLGNDGSGTAAHYHLEGQVDVQVGTLSKSLAAEGGYVAGKKIIIDYLRNKSRPFIFSTFLSPADMAAALAALRLLRKDAPAYLQRLRENTEYVRRALTAAGLPVVPGTTPIVPVIVGAADLAVKLEQRLRQEGILLSAIRPPTVAPGSSRLRITVTAAHTQTQLQQLVAALGRAWLECM
ncbi:MAG: 8-amino-7-oxononanoate synthase [Acidaminococcaceae bacterium]|nr:8-amino-7-oxononanoate synthase [Acidaminococcaceae bacterium]